MDAKTAFDGIRTEIADLESKISHGAASPADLDPLKGKIEALESSAELNAPVAADKGEPQPITDTQTQGQ